MSVDQAAGNRIAIIGMAGRFPGAADVEQLWGNLVGGVESLTELTDEQLRANGAPRAQMNDPNYVRLRPMLADMEYFDAKYFGYSTREAEVVDPQQRIFLEVCHTALQQAGYDPARYQGSIGVYGGSGPNRYNYENIYSNAKVRRAVGDMAVEINNNQDYLAARVAYALGLTGPAVSIATACSTSLVAVHLAYRALATGECAMAIAGGVNVMLPYYRGQRWAENSIYTRDGHVRAFDAAASGTNFGHGAGAVVLKRYEDAVKDGDHILAVIIGSAVNNDGARPTFTAPAQDGQQAVISEALEVAGVHPDSIGYVEAHGTATAVGDPIEVSALSAAYRAAGATGSQVCPIGSIKTNVGHLGPAAGVAGLIKAVLAMRNTLIPASLNFTTPNPKIPFEETPFYVNRELSPWAEGETPRRAGVSSFGIGGTNAHVIIEEAPEVPPGPSSRPWRVLPLSAKTETSLATMRAQLAEHLRTHPELPVEDVSHTLTVGRPALEHRSFVVARDGAEAAAELEGAGPVGAARTGAPTPVALMFPGQGTQHVDMAAELYATEPLFAATVDHCATLLRPHLGCDIRDVIFSARGAGDHERMAESLRATRLAQPALFVIEYALATLWLSRGLRPTAMVGHSIGEYVAACLAEVFTLPEALELVAIRGALVQSMPPGDMLAVPMREADLAPLLTDSLSLAAVNSPSTSVVAGPADEVELLLGWLDARGVTSRRLRTSHAFHSAMMDPAMEPLRAAVARIGPKKPTRAFVSTLTGTWITPEQATDPGYWADQLRGTVRFAQACQVIGESGAILLEVGPAQTLTTLARQTLGKAATVVPSLSRAGSAESDLRWLAVAAGTLWTHGAEIDWTIVQDPRGRRRVPLPAYPFERQRFWVEPDDLHEDAALEEESQALAIEDATFVPVWRPRRRGAAAGITGSWLVFTTGDELVESLADQLAARGASVVRVGLGDGFADLGDGRYEVSPASRADYRALLAALDEAAWRPTSVLHGWTAMPGQSDVDAVKDAGFYSLLFLTQSLEEAWPDHRVGIRVLTSECCNVSGADPVEPVKALLIGPCRVVPTESSTLSCQLIDVSASSAEHLLAELAAPIEDDTVAYRAGRRWVQEYDQVSLPSRTELPWVLRRRGVYLITGGTGGIALEVAKELARTVAARLVLVNRTPMPPRDQWDERLSAADDDQLSARILGVRQVEELGGEVLVAAADVADEAAMREVLLAARERFGRIDGVFHAAGVAGGGLAAMRSRENADLVLAPKVDGTLVLDRLLGQEVDLFVMFSSIVAVTGDYGMVDYCSANAFMDAFAQARAAGRRQTVSVNWCGWTEVGMLEKTLASAPSGFRDLERGIGYSTAGHPLLGRRVLGTGDDIVFSARIDGDFHWVLTDHQMAGRPVFPGTAYAEIVCAAYREAVQDGPVEIRDLFFTRPLAIDGPRELRVTGRRNSSKVFEFTVSSRPCDQGDAPWEQHALAYASAGAEAGPDRHDVAAISARCDLVTWDPDLDSPLSPVVFGPHWRVVDSVRSGHGEHLVSLTLPEELTADVGAFCVHPSLLDGATSLGLFLPELAAAGRTFLPLAYDRLSVHAPLPPRVFSHVREVGARGAERDVASYDITILDEGGAELVTISGFSVRYLDTAAARQDRPAAGGAITTGGSASGGSDQILETLITPGQGVDLMWRVLSGPAEPQYVVTRERPTDRARRIARIAAGIAEAAGGQLAGTAVRDPRIPLVSPGTATKTEEQLIELWQDAFGLSRLGLDEDFFDLGGNSLVSVQLAVRIRERFGINLSGIVILEYPTVRELAVQVDEALADR
ncbi:SDR family NAD(P)-dependent oxidoreductase [Nonomuraea sp. NPDC049158]|uniref:type I polyketide synthase n=1 Tax=Nonomuraea sp. NPDC049158 TaxID=3155649 RepID=UPI003402A086